MNETMWNKILPVNLEASPVVILNALGFIGFKVIAVAGTVQVGKFRTSLIPQLLN